VPRTKRSKRRIKKCMALLAEKRMVAVPKRWPMKQYWRAEIKHF
jgi:hypothetical protein